MLESIGLKEAANKVGGRYKINCFLKINKIPDFLVGLKLSKDLEYLDFRQGEKYSKLLLQCETTKVDLMDILSLVDITRSAEFYFIPDDEYSFKKVVI